MDASVSYLGSPDRGKVLSVLIVDDHDVYRFGLRNILSTIEGFTVVAEASSCKAALECLETKAVDLVLMDLLLPDGDGLECIKQIAQLPLPPRVIVISVMMDDDKLLDTMLAHASGYLTKDLPAPDMIRSLQGFQRGELAMQPSVMQRAITLLVQRCQELHNELMPHLQTVTNATAVVLSESEVQDPALMAPRYSSSIQLPILTAQEEKVYQLMRQGQSNKQIGAHLSISRFTVGKHVQNILRKLRVVNRTQAASFTSLSAIDAYSNSDSPFR